MPFPLAVHRARGRSRERLRVRIQRQAVGAQSMGAGPAAGQGLHRRHPLALGLLQCSSAATPASPAAAAVPAAALSAHTPGPAPRELEIASWNLDWLNRRAQRGPVRRGSADYERLRRYARRLRADRRALGSPPSPVALNVLVHSH